MRISAYFISLLISIAVFPLHAQDSIRIPLKIRIGADISGPFYYFADSAKTRLSIEGSVSVDLNYKMAVVVEAGFARFSYGQYNYKYSAKGTFVRVGFDFNFIQPEMTKGKYYAGIGLRYGLSLYNSEVPYYKHENYWGTSAGSIPSSTYLGHFIEASPGIRTEIFNNFSIGWAIRLRILISSGTDKDQKPVYFPGYGNGTKSFSPGINYYIVWSIPYKEIIYKKPLSKTAETTVN
jgi:hypothetical protein